MSEKHRNPTQPPLGFLKTCALGALLIVVPIGIVGIALWQVIRLAEDLLGPLFGILPFDSVTIRVLAIVGALLLVVLLCYVTGVLVRTRWGHRLRRWLDRYFLEKIPGYRMIRSITHQYLGHVDERKFRPVMVDLHNSGAKMIGLEIEELGDATVAVFLPSVPAVTLGQVQIVPQERVTPIPASLHAAIETLTMFGEGASNLIKPDQDRNCQEAGDTLGSR